MLGVHSPTNLQPQPNLFFFVFKGYMLKIGFWGLGLSEKSAGKIWESKCEIQDLM